MLLLELAHVDDGQVLLAAIEQVGDRQRGLGLADARGAGHQEDADRLARVGQPGAAGADRLRDGVQRMLLADHALHQLVLAASARSGSRRRPCGRPECRSRWPTTSATAWPSTTGCTSGSSPCSVAQRRQRFGEVASSAPSVSSARRAASGRSAARPPHLAGAGRGSRPTSSFSSSQRSFSAVELGLTALLLLGQQRRCRAAWSAPVGVLATDGAELGVDQREPARAVLDRRRDRRPGSCATRAQAVSSSDTPLSGSWRDGM